MWPASITAALADHPKQKSSAASAPTAKCGAAPAAGQADIPAAVRIAAAEAAAATAEEVAGAEVAAGIVGAVAAVVGAADMAEAVVGVAEEVAADMATEPLT